MHVGGLAARWGLLHSVGLCIIVVWALTVDFFMLMTECLPSRGDFEKQDGVISVDHIEVKALEGNMAVSLPFVFRLYAGMYVCM